MLGLFKRIRDQYFHAISTDESKIFQIIAERLPPPLGDLFRSNVQAICKSENQGDGKTIVYRLNKDKVGEVQGKKRLDVRSGLQRYVTLTIALNDVRQPFLCFVQDGYLHSLKILQPQGLASGVPEFAVLAFKLEGDRN